MFIVATHPYSSNLTPTLDRVAFTESSDRLMRIPQAVIPLSATLSKAAGLAPMVTCVENNTLLDDDI